MRELQQKIFEMLLMADSKNEQLSLETARELFKKIMKKLQQGD